MSQPLETLAVESTRDAFAAAVLDGLSRPDKQIPCRFFYDAHGSHLFEQITKLEEYYPTRTEIALLERHIDDFATRVRPDTALIEFGSGSSRKTRILLDGLTDLTAYVPIDISSSALELARDQLEPAYPNLEIMPLHGDFARMSELPQAVSRHRLLGFFPGSTIGNFSHDEAISFLAHVRKLLGPAGALLIGADLKKPTDILLPAYDDADGVTADFNLNLLRRINRELGGTFDLGLFAHEAIYNNAEGRVEIYLVSLVDQQADVLGHRFRFREGERIHTENSHKYTAEGFTEMVGEAGWLSDGIWTVPQRLFSLHWLRAPHI